MTPPALRLASSEIRRFTRGRTRRAALVVMVLIPLLYGALYLWAFWNPYGNLDRVPVAVVDLDTPVHSATGTVDVGAQLTDKLIAGHVLAWSRTTAAQARKGVADGTYYASLTIPADFSASIASLATATPHHAQLLAEVNAASNYIAAQIMNTVFASVQHAAAATFSSAYLDHVFAALGGSSSSAAKAATGARQLAHGASELRSLVALYPFTDPTAAHSSAFHEILEVSGAVAAGSAKLADGLGAAATRASPFTAANAASRAAVAATPVTLLSRQLHLVPNYGTAFAPYFIPLALWVGCMMLFFLLRPLSPRALAVGTRPGAVALGGLLPVATLGMLQGAIVLVVVQLGLGLHAAHPLAMWGFVLLSAVTFAAVLQMLEAVLGPAGRVVALAVLILQLVSSAGTYPIQTSPGFIQWVQPLLPMTYMVNGMRDAVSGSLIYLGHDAAVLVLWLAIALGITVLAAARRRVLSCKQVQPEIQMSMG